MKYSSDESVQMYRNFLSWLFRTFQVSEREFRTSLVSLLNLEDGHRVLITGCGLGDDIPPMQETAQVAIEAQDLSESMISAAKERFGGVAFHVGDACRLDFPDAIFDAAFHFGGLNEFPDRGAALREMARVVKDGGRVVVSDEGVAPWLKSTDYGKMVVANNPLWGASAPIDLLPFSATAVSMNWVLGNCFYVIAFTVQRRGPLIDPDVPHVGGRGGTMRTRYYGQLEGVSVETKAFVQTEAKRKGLSIHEYLEQALRPRT